MDPSRTLPGPFPDPSRTLLGPFSDPSLQAAKELANWASMDPQFADKGIVHAFEAPRAPELLAFDSPV